MGPDSPAITLSGAFADRLPQWGADTAVSFLRDGCLETRLSYGELNRDVNRMANAFLDSGVSKGDRILLSLPKSLVGVVAGLASYRIGAIAVPLNPGFTPSEMAYFLADSGPTIVLAGAEQAGMAGSLDPSLAVIAVADGRSYQDIDFFRSASDGPPGMSPSPDDPGLIIYTSGTTGKPKGAILTQKNLIHDAENIIDVWDITRGDRLCHALPLFHVHGLCFALHTALLAGAHVVMQDQFDPETTIGLLSRTHEEIPGSPCNLLMAVPSMYQKLWGRLEDAGRDFGHIRLLTSGSAPLLPRDFCRIHSLFGQAPVEREGMSETGMNFTNPIHGIRKPGSIGLPLPGLRVRIVDPASFTDVEPGGIGELWLKSASITPGYWRKPEATGEAFREGWFRTGDLGRVDGDGYYYLTDRIKHIIISGGENISPKEIESVINQCPDVTESAVVGISDEDWGEKVVAAIVPAPDAPEPVEAAEALCRQHLHRWKIPKAFLVLDALPRNTMGKVLVEEVKAAFLAGKPAA